MATPESKVKRRVTTLLRELRAWYCFPVATGYGHVGVPDILACMFGAFIAIECKSGRNKVTALQQLQLDEIRYSGGATWVVNEEGFEQFEKEIRQMYTLWNTPMNELTGDSRQ